ncbi:hypothetical protein ECIAI1_2653 [Escherichia coli IAI1]|nr:hypothetical protein ECIAI1_2653 [Escherichia coli IAI1]
MFCKIAGISVPKGELGGKNARFGNRWNHAEPPKREGGSALQTLWQAGRNYWNHWNRLSTRNPIYI